MCGIAGVVGANVDRELLERMAAVLEHRGPDDQGILVDGIAGLAFRRLSIIDVAGGHQPIFNEDESAAIIFNGEVYNYRELRAGLTQRGHRFRTKSDVEVVLHLWEEKGPRCVADLRGMFAFAIWDRRERALFLARDRVGKKPLYYALLPGGGLVFGSEIKAVVQHPDIGREPDPAAIDQFLTLQYVPSPMTAFRGIERVAPGHWLTWRAGKVATERYWRLDYEDKLRRPAAELRAELLRLLREAVKIRLESEVPLGAFLSGGIDSSAVVAFASEQSSKRLSTFTIAFDSRDHDESRYARLVAERFGTDHHELTAEAGGAELVDDIVWHHDQPFGDSSAIPSFQVARLTRPYVTVVLNGDGGDESFAGYDRYQLSRFGGYFRLPSPLRSGIQGLARKTGGMIGRGQRLVQGRVRDPFEAYFAALVHLHPDRRRWLYTSEFLAIADGAEPEIIDFMRTRVHGALLDSMLDADVNHYLPDDLLVKMDVATMAHSLEARSPLLDQRLMEFMARVPAGLKLRGGQSKHMLKAALRGILPDEILDRPKRGFGVPLGRWLRGPLRELLVDTVLSGRSVSRGYFEPAAVNEMVSSLLRGSDRHQYVLWDLLVLERWFQLFIDSAPMPRTIAHAPAARPG